MYYVRIKGVLVFNKVCPYVCKQFLLGLQAMKKNIIDLYMKSGLYITEIVKRLYQSEQMEKQFPDPKERLRHIFEKQVYGLAPTEIIYHIALSYILGFNEDTKDIKHNFR